jgi:hypothetical protein
MGALGHGALGHGAWGLTGMGAWGMGHGGMAKHWDQPAESASAVRSWADAQKGS